MGSPLGPTLANFCLAHHESSLLKDNAPALYLRYVDDIFCVFRDGSNHQAFLDKLNNFHPNLKFTAEIGPSTLPFLDTSISLPDVENGSFTSKVYRKPTFTGLLLNFNAICPFKWKLGLIECMLHRAYNISSNWSLFVEEVEFLQKTFIENAYPLQLFTSCVNRFIMKKFKPEQPCIDQEKMETIFVIPYIGKASVIFGNKLCKLFKSQFLVDVKVVYTSFKVKNYFSLKCRTPLPLMAKTVYKYTCSRDANLTYIGKTKRHLATRVKEHGCTNPPTTAIGNHLTTCMACRSHFSLNKFKIIDTARSNLQCCIKEAIYIKRQKPIINTQLTTTSGMSFFLNIF